MTTIVSTTDQYRLRRGLPLTRSASEQRSRPEPEAEEMYDMSDPENDLEADPGAWVRELDARQADIVNPFAEVEASVSSELDYDAMLRRRARFERLAYDREKARGRELTRDELADAWDAADGADDVVGDLSWLRGPEAA